MPNSFAELDFLLHQNFPNAKIVRHINMDYWGGKVIKHRFMLLLLFVYFSIHLTNLTLLPIFNDEAIYLDWGWTHTHMPGRLFDSLLDAKQPLIIWIFGIFERFFSDPLFAGRFASVLIGFITLLGIYKITKKLLNEDNAFISALLYSIIPIFVFYNRQALMEAAIVCVGIWSFNALLNLLQSPITKNGIILGIILGIGFFIKSLSLIFIASASVLMLFYLVIKKRKELLKPYLVSLITIVAVDSLLLINSLFWQTFSSNSRYSYAPAELFTFPLVSWLNNLLGFAEIGFVFVTPLIFISGIVGIFMMRKDRIENNQIFLAYFITVLLLEILSVRSQNQRYIVAFLPFFAIPASYVLNSLWRSNIWGKSVLIISFFIPIFFSLILIFNPEYYIMQLSKISKYSEVGYVRGQTSGYGINETMRYIKEHSSSSQPSMVVFGLNIGNPESAADLYSQKAPNLAALHIDSKFFQGLDQYQCLTSKYPVFFVTRDGQLAGMDRYFSEEVSFPNPDNTYSVGIYTIKKDCSGNALSLSEIYQGAISKVFEMKSGY